jgi:uncharacterized protein
VLNHPAVAWTAPFVVFLALLAGAPHLGLPARADLALRLLLPAAAIYYFSRRLLRVRWTSGLLSTLLGVAVFGLWVAPDLLIPGWRQHWLFQNPLFGTLQSSLPSGAAGDTVSLWLRGLRAALVVPILEELFWRGWLMRWIINPQFETVPLGQYQARAFWLTAVLFALEHGPYWEVGLLTGAIFNWWMVRTKSVEDCIWAHAVTNACLSVFVVTTGRWEYWL